MSYRFVQGLDYGPRRGTLGVAIHMAEGGDGTVSYLARRSGETRTEWATRVRGVSANFVIVSTGEVVQMVDWARASGSMNPADRSTDDEAFYGRRYLVEVLGVRAPDPNAWSLSVEITGFRREGPNRAQVEALIRLVAEARKRYPRLVGAFGHADQTDTKSCPGTHPLMREAWARIGHGAFPASQPAAEDDMRSFTLLPGPPGRLTVRDGGHYWVRLRDGALRGPIDPAAFGPKEPAYPVRLTEPIPGGPPGADRATGYLIGDEAAFLLASDVDFAPEARDYPVTVGGKPAGSVRLP